MDVSNKRVREILRGRGDVKTINMFLFLSIYRERLVQTKQKGGNRQLMASGTVSCENAREANHFAKEITATDLCDHAFHQPFRANHPAASSLESPLITRGNIVSVTSSN